MTTFLDPDAINRLMNSEDGPVMRHLAELGTRVQTRAKELVGKDTHRLEQSIVKRFISEGGKGAIAIVALTEYALYHHEGTRPHMIFPVRAKVLAFPASKGSTDMVFARSVMHPGTKPNHFLTDAAAEILGAA